MIACSRGIFTLLPPANEIAGRMFSVVSVYHCLSIRGVPCDNYLWCHWSVTSHVGTLHPSFPTLTIPGPPRPSRLPSPYRVWHLQTCSLEPHHPAPPPPRLPRHVRSNLLVSTYVVCERLSVMHEPAGVVENLVQNSTVYPYSAIQNNPPPPKKWKLSEILALWLFSCRIPPPVKMKIVRNLGTLTFQLQNTPPLQNWNLGRSWHFVIFQLQKSPPPPENENCQKSWHFDFSVAEYPPPQLKFRQILALCDFSVAEYPPTIDTVHTHTHNTHTYTLCHLVCIVGEIILHCG